MKQIAVVNFTKNTTELNNEIVKILDRHNYVCTSHSADKSAGEAELGNTKLKETKLWIDDNWKQTDAFIFIGGTDVVLRLILKHVENATKDPAVLVIDEECKYIVPILGNHVGLGNDLSTKLAKLVNAKEIITTPKEVQEKFTIEKFAERNAMEFGKKEQARAISLAILEGHHIGFFSECEISGEIPCGLNLCKDDKELSWYAQRIAIRNEYVVGMGLQENVAYGNVEELFLEQIKEMNIEVAQVKGIATIIDRKDESALRLLSEEYQIPILSYTIKEFRSVNSLKSAESIPRSEANISERAAILGSEYGELVRTKVVGNGVTFAAAKKLRTIYFD